MDSFKNEWNNKIILIAEDVVYNYKLLDKHLKNVGAKTLWAQNGKEAIKICNLHGNKIDIILMDMKMPIKNGIEACEEIKGKWPNIPIIVQTAYASLLHADQKSNELFDGFLAKPVRKEALFSIISNFL